MKVKQNSELKYVADLEAKIEALGPYYAEHKHQ
jgi:hypothetical protein